MVIMKRQGGFTLIELVVVIVILGILAVTAAPRFLNLQGDAREASLQGLKGAMQGAAGIVYGKAAIDGIETRPHTDSSPAVGGVTTHYGYPTATSAGIGNAVSGITTDWISNTPSGTPTPREIQYSFSGNTKWEKDNNGCNVTYAEATSTAAPIATVYAGGC
uniref:Mannose-sensitive hemagglutinin a n=1 Tax=Vibrio cholerae non-O1 TaxID=66861 RepID=Q76KN3_VIBCL|nr:mannose-sensitive hemagglutinin a [Vibrio cholerae non-O1]